MTALMHIYNDGISSDGSGMLGDKSSASERRFRSARWPRLRLPEQASLVLVSPIPVYVICAVFLLENKICVLAKL